MAKQVEQSLPILNEFEKPGIDSEGVEKVYAKWAEEYDKDMVTLNYTQPSVGAAEIEKCLKDNKDAVILDAACGTGLGGIELTKRGFHNLHGFDMCSKMLEKAKQKNIYKKVMCMRLGPEVLDIPNDTYDAVMMTGAVGNAHMDGRCLAEFIRIVKPGGYVVMNATGKYINGGEYGGKSWEELIDDYLMAGRWVTVTRRKMENAFNSLDGMKYAFQVK